MKTRLLVVPFVVAVHALATPPVDGGPPPAPIGAPADGGAPFVLDGDAAKGQRKFEQLCVSCHGAKGRGDGKAAAAAKLDPRPTNFTDPRNAARLTPEWIYQVIRDGGPTHGKSPLMVSWGGTLTDADVRDLASHVLRLKTATKSKAR